VWRALVITLSLTTLACGTQAEAQPQVVRSGGTTTTTTIDWPAVIRRQQNERIWWAEVVAQQIRARDYARLLRFAAAVEAARLADLARNNYRGSCGGSLPSCAVLARESGGDPRVWNGGCYAPYGWRGKSPCGTSSASGRWQIVRPTWNYCRTGYVNAADAPVRVQDDCARRILQVQPCAWCL